MGDGERRGGQGPDATRRLRSTYSHRWYEGMRNVLDSSLVAAQENSTVYPYKSHPPRPQLSLPRFHHLLHPLHCPPLLKRGFKFQLRPATRLSRITGCFSPKLQPPWLPCCSPHLADSIRPPVSEHKRHTVALSRCRHLPQLRLLRSSGCYFLSFTTPHREGAKISDVTGRWPSYQLPRYCAPRQRG